VLDDKRPRLLHNWEYKHFLKYLEDWEAIYGSCYDQPCSKYEEPGQSYTYTDLQEWSPRLAKLLSTERLVVLRCLERIPTISKRLIDLRFFHNTPVKEVMTILNLSEETVTQLIDDSAETLWETVKKELKNIPKY
jgi:DNA-directed RNA polymerase specialized sigma subunit